MRNEFTEHIEQSLERRKIGFFKRLKNITRLLHAKGILEITRIEWKGSKIEGTALLELRCENCVVGTTL
jgi:hypothetical protein